MFEADMEVDAMMEQWVSEEFQTIDLGDKRRNDRAAEVLSMLGSYPSKSIPACVGGGHNETTAAYRLFDNDSIGFADLLAPHIDATYERLAQHDRVLLIQDTTELDLTRPGQQVAGAGPLDASSRRGGFLHPMLAFTSEGVPLGAVSTEFWVREDGPGQADDRKQRAIEEKESLRWLDGQREAQRIAAEHPDTEVIAIADSEADIFEVLELENDSPSNFGWIIRGCYDRSLVRPDSPCDEQGRHLRSHLEGSDELFRKTISLRGRDQKISCDDHKRRQPRESRDCQVAIRAATVTLSNPYRADRTLRETTVNVISVYEVDPPPDEPAVDWVLLTNLPISTHEEIELIIAYYCLRWLIELFFRALKSGTRIEKRRFETIERFERCLALTMIVAWRTFYLYRVGRENPNADCEHVLRPDEWQPVYKITTGEDPPKQPPPIWQMIRLIARLGGYVDRCRDDEPGIDTTMRGMERLHDISLCWNTFGPGSKTIPKARNCV